MKSLASFLKRPPIAPSEALQIPNRQGGTLVLLDEASIVTLTQPHTVLAPKIPFNSPEALEEVIWAMLEAATRQHGPSEAPAYPAAIITAPYGPAYEAQHHALPTKPLRLTRARVPPCLRLALHEALGFIHYEDTNVAIAIYPEAVTYTEVPYVLRF